MLLIYIVIDSKLGNQGIQIDTPSYHFDKMYNYSTSGQENINFNGCHDFNLHQIAGVRPVDEDLGFDPS